jgi:hypothetical protein
MKMKEGSDQTEGNIVPTAACDPYKHGRYAFRE